ncbi:MAG: TetR/AcrR family transcriptional regulator [Acidimicrobiales bacterium]|nr:TetR/AcrR family transcriptional regulator [Acidimicrobiales bacterium]
MIPEVNVSVSRLAGVHEDETRAGRPRDPGRDDAILAAALDLLGEVGYEQVTVRAIAQRAGAGLATLYRRWPTKEDLVVDAVARVEDVVGEADLDADPVDAMVDLVSGLVDVLQGPRRGLIPNLVGQTAANPALGEALRSRVVLPRLAAVTSQLRRVPGVEPARVDEAARLVPATAFFDVIVLGRHLDARDVRRIVDRSVALATGCPPEAEGTP